MDARHAALQELADSIRTHGLLQPLLVSERGEGRYVLIAGERRWRAARLAGLATVSVVIRERLDEGAAIALNNGKSLLPAGVTEVTGTFHRGDAVRVLDPSGKELGRGLSAYSAGEARLIIGHNSREIESLLGYRGREELVHRDDLVLIRGRKS